MNVSDVKERLAEIEKIAELGDDESAHSEQDRLFRDVLATIAGGTTGMAALAREALRVMDIEFARWCA